MRLPVITNNHYHCFVSNWIILLYTRYKFNDNHTQEFEHADSARKCFDPYSGKMSKNHFFLLYHMSVIILSRL